MKPNAACISKKPSKRKSFFASLHFTELRFDGKKKKKERKKKKKKTKWKSQSILINPEYKNIWEAHWQIVELVTKNLARVWQ